MKSIIISMMALGAMTTLDLGSVDSATAGEAMVLTNSQLDQVVAAGRAEERLELLTSRAPTLIRFDEDRTSGPLVESLVLDFEIFDPGPAPVLPFRVFTLERNETARLPRYTPEWTDFNASDPGR